MPVQSIECQLTQAQVKRYLAGADFPEAMLARIEIHLKACPDCMAEANRQRETLGGSSTEVVQAVVETPVQPSPLDRIKALFQRPARQPDATLVGPVGTDPFAVGPVERLKSPKNLVLSLSLAAVLVLMSTVLKDPTALFGPRASSVTSTPPATSEEAAPEAQGTEEAETPPNAKNDSHDEATPSGVEEPVNTGASAEPETDGHNEKVVPPDSGGTHAVSASTEPTTPESAHKEPVSTAKPSPVKPEKPKTENHKVGGSVIVIDSSRSAVSKATAAHPPVKAHATAKPARQQTKVRRPSPRKISKPSPAAKSSGIRVYNPDGTLKK